MKPYPTRAHLDDELAHLEAAVAEILRDFPERFQLTAIANEGEYIRQSAAPADRDYVSTRVQAILINAGLIERASDDE